MAGTFLLAYAASMLFIAAQVPGDGLPAGEVTLDDVLAAWQQREDEARTVQVEWMELQVTPIAGVQMPDAESQARLEAQGDMVKRSRNVMLLDGRRVRLTEDPSGESVDQNRQLIVFDGILGKGLIYRTVLDYPEGAISENQAPNRNLAKYIPLLVAFRLQDEHMRPFDASEYVLTDERVEIDDRACRVVEAREAPGPRGTGQVRKLYIDPGQDFVIRRMERVRDGVVRSRVDFSWAGDPSFGSLPTGWRLVSVKPDGSISSSIEGDVVDCQLDPPVSDADFQLEFPVGTRYFDSRDGTRRMLIVQAPNQPREFFPAEIQRGATQEDLLSTPPGQARLELNNTSSSTTWLVIGMNVLVLSVIGAWLGVRYLRGGRSTAPM
ncbi:MAG: hypothetical protein KF861_03875 [Planctomycetaceae bacterium]|nr:hypothetical protein [Planctomycetaceae bacterium]